MSGVDGAGADERGVSAPAVVAALRAELGDSLRAAAWYRDGDRGLLYVHSEVDAPDERLGAALQRRPDGEPRTFEYAIDAYGEVVVVTLSLRAFVPPTGGVAGVALAVERDGPLSEITAAIERAVAAARTG